MPEGVTIPGISVLEDLVNAFYPEIGTPVKFGLALQLLRSIQEGKLDQNIEILEVEMMKVVKMTTPLLFATRWMWMRNWLPLQMRLLMEQVFWRMGDPYTKLITGFGPIKLEAFREGDLIFAKVLEAGKKEVGGGKGGTKKYKRHPPRPRDYTRTPGRRGWIRKKGR